MASSANDNVLRAVGSQMISEDYLTKQLNAVCEIEVPGKGKATGFIGHLKHNGKDLYFLITNHHVLSKRQDTSKALITFGHVTKEKPPCVLKAEEFCDVSGKRFTDNRTNLQDNTKYGLDFTFVEVKKEKLGELIPFDLTPTQLDEGDQVIIPHHPARPDDVSQQKPRQLSFHRCKKKIGFLTFYGCETFKGSSGSPVLKIVNNELRVVAIHRAGTGKFLYYGSLFSAILTHATLLDGEVPETTTLMFDKFMEQVKWEPMSTAKLLRLLKPIEHKWDILAKYILKAGLQYNIQTIETDCFHTDTSERALNEVISEWTDHTPKDKRTWRTLRDAAKDWEDDSLEQYMVDNKLQEGDDPYEQMCHVHRWSKGSPLSINWFGFAVQLVGESKAKMIRAKYGGGGVHACLQHLLVLWQESTIAQYYNWQVIIDALTEMEEIRVIETIEDNCLAK